MRSSSGAVEVALEEIFIRLRRLHRQGTPFDSIARQIPALQGRERTRAIDHANPEG
jgi:hypothetical protein